MDDQRDDSDDSEDPQPTTVGSGRVRIIGAETAGTTTGQDPDAPVAPVAGPVRVEDAAGDPGPEAADAAEPAGTQLLHWTEAPTGEVPAVLIREPAKGSEGAGDSWSSMPGPTWKEEHADWEAHEDAYEPSVLVQDETPLGSLDDSGATDRQPWEFEVPLPGEQPAAPGAAPGLQAATDDDTAMVPAVGRTGPLPATSEVAFRFDEVEEPGVPGPAGHSGELEESGGLGPVGGDPDAGGGAASPGATGIPGTSGGRRQLASSLRSSEAAAVPGDGDGLVPPAEVTEEPVIEEWDAEEARGRRLRRARARAGEDSPGTAAAADAVFPDEIAGPLASSDATGVPGANRPVPQAPPGPRRPAGRPGPGAGVAPSGVERPYARPPAGQIPAGQIPDDQYPAHGDRNISVAVVSGLVVAVVTLVFFKLGTVTAMIVSTAVVALAAVEGYAAFRKAGYRPATLLGLVATVSLMVATYDRGQEALFLVLVLLVAFTLLWHLVGVERGADPVLSSMATLFVFCWVGVLGSYAALLLNPALFPDRHGIAFLLGGVMIVVAYDIGAWAFGARFGHHQLAPRVSPNKTWEGLIGGAVVGILVAVVLVPFVHPWTLGSAALLGVVVAVVCPIGDLSESLVKRNLGLKDMGRILPGHGGVLDRVDGLLFVVPATYYLVKAFHLG